MIKEILIYSLESAVIFSLLFIPYLFIKNDTFFTRNRFYLIFSLMVSLIFPLLNFEVESNNPDKPVVYMMEQVNISGQTENMASEISVFSLVGWISIVIGLLFLTRVFFAIFKILKLIQQHTKEKNGSATIVWLKDGGDFSFFRYIFLVKAKYHPYILEHERVHVKRGHSFDILFFEFFRCFQWYNPFVWMALRELKTQHEYEADHVASSVNKNEYQALLLSSVLEVDLVPMTNSFNCLTVKKRFIMMNKKRSGRSAAAKMLVALPFALLAFGMFALNPIANSFSVPVSTMDAGGDEEDEIVQPEFKGGMEALVKYLSENIKYPEKAKTDSISGKVYVSFVISKTGKVEDTKILKSVNAELDAEALRVIQSMPDWTPGTKNGKKTEVTMTLPINFQL